MRLIKYTVLLLINNVYSVTVGDITADEYHESEKEIIAKAQQESF